MDREKRIEENEKLFREVNERVDQLQDTLQSGAGQEWICECGDEGCFDKLTLPIDEYREIRSHEDWFVIKPGHQKLAVERVVKEANGFAVVQKYDV